jgi:hypothetical protein
MTRRLAFLGQSKLVRNVLRIDFVQVVRQGILGCQRSP